MNIQQPNNFDKFNCVIDNMIIQINKFKTFEQTVDGYINEIVNRNNFIINNFNNNTYEYQNFNENFYENTNENINDINQLSNENLCRDFINSNEPKINRLDLNGKIEYKRINEEKDLNNFSFKYDQNIIDRYINIDLLKNKGIDEFKSIFNSNINTLINILKEKVKDNLEGENYLVHYNDFNLYHKYNDIESNTITGRVYPSIFMKYSDVKTFRDNSKVQVINVNDIKDLNVKSLMTYINFNWYIYVYKQLYSVQKSNQIIYNNKNNALFRLFYTTRLDDTCLNVNFNASQNKNEILGFQFYLSKVESNNIVNFMFLTSCPILVSINAKSNRNVSSNRKKISNYSKGCTLTYFLNNTIYRRYGKADFSTDIILGPSVQSEFKNGENIKPDLLEYKFINKITFIDDVNIIIILVIPFIVNSSREACYKYDIIIKFYNKENHRYERTLTGNDFFIYEEFVTKFIDCIANDNFNGFNYKGVPAALEKNGLEVPPIINFDKIIIDNTKKLETSKLLGIYGENMQ